MRSIVTALALWCSVYAAAEIFQSRRGSCPQVAYCPATQVCPEPPLCTYPSTSSGSVGATGGGCRLECGLRWNGKAFTVSSVRKAEDACSPGVCDERREVCEAFLQGMHFAANTSAVFVPSTCRQERDSPQAEKPSAGPEEIRIKVKRVGGGPGGLMVTYGTTPVGTLQASETETTIPFDTWRLDGKEKFRIHGNLGADSKVRLSLVCGKDRTPIPLGKAGTFGKHAYYDLPLPKEVTGSLDCEVTADFTAGPSVKERPLQCCFCEIGKNLKQKEENEEKCRAEFAAWGNANQTFCDLTETRVKSAILVDPAANRTSITRENKLYPCADSFVVSADHSHSGQLKCFADSIGNMIDTVSRTNGGQTGKPNVFQLKDCGCAGGSDLKKGLSPELVREIKERLKDAKYSAVAELVLNQTTVTFDSTSWVKLKVNVEGTTCKKNGDSTATVRVELSYLPCGELFQSDCNTYLGNSAKCEWKNQTRVAKCCHPPYKNEGHSWFLEEDCRRIPPCEYDGKYFRGLKGSELYPTDFPETLLVGTACSPSDVPHPYSCRKPSGSEVPLICQDKKLAVSDKLECSSIFGSATLCYQPGKTLTCYEKGEKREAKCCYDFSFPPITDPTHPPWQRYYSKWKPSDKCETDLDAGDCDVLAKKWCADEAALPTYKAEVTCGRQGKRCRASCTPSGDFDLDRGTPWIVRCPGDADGGADTGNH